MAEIHVNDPIPHDEPEMPTGEELAGRLFALVMAGVLGVIVFMAAMGGW